MVDQIALFPAVRPDQGAWPGWVYYGFAEDHRVKIGYSTNYRRRGGELHIDIRYRFPGDELREREEHRRWARYRIGSSEWFHPSHEMVRWLITQMWRQPGGASSDDVIAVVGLLAPEQHRIAA